MDIIQALTLGIVQGLTEFLPVSSSGHLILLPSIFGWEVQSLAFDTVLHLGTVGALIIYFWKDLVQVIWDKKMLGLLVIGSIPAAALGFLLGDFLEVQFRSAQFVALFLLVGSLLMFVAERVYKKVWHSERVETPESLSYTKGFVIGLFQSLALLSGVSRSGSTMSGGMLLGLTREAAARFSFILSIPVVVGAGLFKVVESYQELSLDLSLLAGFLASFLVGMLAISYLLKFLKSNTLSVFILYRVLLAAIILFLL